MIARPHPEQGFRTCLGILALTRTRRRARGRGLPASRRIEARSVASIRSILKNRLDRAFLDEDGRSDASPPYTNIRGHGHFDRPERIRDACPSNA